MTAQPPARYDDLRAVVVNCTLTPSPGRSHTQVLLDRAVGLMRGQGVGVDVIARWTTSCRPACRRT